MAKDYKNKKGATGKKYTTVGDVIKVTYTDGSTRVVRPTDASYAVTKKAMQDDISSKKLFKTGNSKTTAQTALGANSAGAGVVTTAKQKAQQDNYRNVVNQRRAQEQAVSGKLPAQQTAQVVNNAINAMLAQKAVNTAKGVTTKALKSGVEHGVHNTVSGLNQGMAGALNTLGRAGMVEGVPYAALANNMAKNLDIQRNYQKAMDAQRIGMGQLQKNLAMQDAVKRQQIAGKYGPMTGGEQFVSDIVSNLIPIAPSMAAGVIGGGVAPALGTVAAMAPMYTYARGLSTGQALQDGATVNQANAYGIGKGMVETGTEMLTKNMAGLPGKFEVGKKLADAVTNPTAKKVGAAAGDILSGAGEEALAELADPFLQNATYKDGEKIDMDAVLYSALLGGVMTGGVNAAAYTAKNVAKMMQEAKNGQLNGQNEAQIAQKPQNTPEQAQNNATTKGITVQPEVAQEQTSQADFQQNQPKIEQKPEPMKFAPEMEQPKQNVKRQYGFSPENQQANDIRPTLDRPTASKMEMAEPTIEESSPTVAENATTEPDFDYEDYDARQLPDDVFDFYSQVGAVGDKSHFNIRIVKNLEEDAEGRYDGNGNILISADRVNDVKTMRRVVAHEVYHDMKDTEEWGDIQDLAFQLYQMDNPGATREQMVQAKIDQYYERSEGRIQLDEKKAWDEIGAELMGNVLSDQTMAERIWNQNPSLAERIVNWLRDKVASIKSRLQGKSEEYGIYKQALEAYSEGLRNMEYRRGAALEGGKEGLFEPAAAKSDSDEVRYSITSLRHDINEGKMHSDLISKGKMTKDEADTFIKNLSDLADHIESFQSTFLDMFEQYGKKDRATLPYKDNSDPLYKISLDFSTLCKKRIITQALIERLQVSRGRALSSEEQIALRDYLKELKKDNDKIEVACAMCYVEAARLRSPKFINEFISNPVKVVQKYLGTKNDAYKAAINDAGNAKLKELGYAENTKLKDVKANSKDHYWAVKNARDAVKDNYKATSPEEIAIIDFLQNEFEPRMVLTADGMMELKQKQPVVYTALNTFLAGKTKSKALQTGEPYYYGDSSTVSDALIEQMNAENGLRHNSWSDFEIIHLLDLLVAVTELSIRDAKVQYYSKVPAEFYVLKDTGAMGNISLIPAGKTGLNENGELEFDPVEGVPFEEAMKIRNDCSRTAGTICIGINDAHIKALLESDVIDYVIPYHTSGLGKVQRKMIGVEGWEDYQNYQNEKNAKGKNAENALKFSDWFHPTEQDIATKSGIEIMREAQQEYLRLCKERGITPKFSNTKEGTDFSKHENYWKLLIDRKMIDNDGNIIMQEAVKPSFDFDYMKELVNQEHANSPQESINEGLRALEGLSDDDLKARAERLKSGKPKKDSMYSLPAKDTNGRRLSEKQAEFFKDSKVRDEKGALKVMYHGSANNFTVFDNEESDDGISFFFTDSLEIANGYSRGKYKVKNPTDNLKVPLNVKDVTRLIGDSHYNVAIVDGKYKITYTDKLAGIYDDVELFTADHDELVDYLEENHWGLNGPLVEPGNYEVYLNIKKPLVLDAKGNAWNNLRSEYNKDATMAAIEQFVDLMKKFDKHMDMSDVLVSLGDVQSMADGLVEFHNGVYTPEEEQQLLDLASQIDNAPDGWDANDVKVEKPKTTREIAREAKDGGYDGVIFENIVDSAWGYGEPSTVAIAFKPEQIKDIYNETPTDSDDIRFSMGKKRDAVGSQEYKELLDEHGAMPEGENPRNSNHRVEVPRSTSEGNRVRQFARNVMEAETIDDVTANMVAEELIDGTSGNLAYEPLANQTIVDAANERIAKSGWKNEYLDLHSRVRANDRITAEDIAVGTRLIQEAQKTGDHKAAAILVTDLAVAGTELGQSIQAFRLLKHLTPEGQLLALKKAQSRINKGLEKQGKKPVSEISEETMVEFLEARGGKKRDEIWNREIARMAQETEGTWMDKLNALRYAAMLSNPKTHIRNIVGNVVMAAARQPTIAISAALEDVRGAVKAMQPNGFEPEQYRSLRNKTGQKYSKLKQYAETNYKAFAKEVLESGGSRYQDVSGAFANNQRIFGDSLPGRALEQVAGSGKYSVSSVLETEDMWFKHKTYVSALTGYMKANGITTKDAALRRVKPNGASIEKGEQYALQQAKKATFTEDNRLSDNISRLENTNTASKILMGGMMPFKRTPMNILTRGIEYSPVGIGMTGYKLVHAMRGTKNKMFGDGTGYNMNDVFESLAANMTGTALLGLGIMLAREGFLTGASGEDDQRKEWYDQQMGSQNFAVTDPETGDSWSIDWLAPAAMPLFTGVEVYNQLSGKYDMDDETQTAQIIGAVGRIADPVFEMSCMQGVAEALSSYSGDAGDIASTVGSTLLTSYGGQFVPALAGAAARTVDDTVRSSYAPKDSPYTKTGEKFLRQQRSKVPYASMENEPSIDVWGNERKREFAGDDASDVAMRALNNFFAPWNYSSNKRTELDDKLDELYRDTGESSVLPKSADTYIDSTESNPKVYLNASEYSRFATTQGEKSRKYVGAFVNSAAYRWLPKSERVEIISNLYSLAKYQAKKEALSMRGYRYSNSNYEKVLKSKMEPSLYYVTKSELDSIADRVSEGQKKQQISHLQELKDSGKITDEQFWYLRRSQIGQFSKAEKASCPYEWIRNM